MLFDYLHGGLHNWAVFCCTVATLGLIGAGIFSVGICFGKGALGFLNGSGRQPQVIIVHEGGRYQPQPQKRTWGLGKTYMLFAAIFSGGPMLTLLIMAVNFYAGLAIDWIGSHWLLFPLLGLAVLIVFAFVHLIRRERQDARLANATSPTPLNDAHLVDLRSPATPMPAVAAESMWGLQDYDGQWSDKG